MKKSRVYIFDKNDALGDEAYLYLLFSYTFSSIISHLHMIFTNYIFNSLQRTKNYNDSIKVSGNFKEK